MSSFSKIEAFRGVDDEGSKAFMMIPAGGFNLIAHDFGKGAALKPDGGLSVLDLTDELKKNVGVATAALIKVLPKNPPTKLVTDALQRARDKLPTLGDTLRLLAITCRNAGTHSLTVQAGKSAAALDVAVVDRLTRKVTFLFLRYTGKGPLTDGQSSGSSHGPTEADAIVAKVNEIFEPQANIHFDLAKAAFLDQNQPFGRKITPRFMDERKLKERIDPAADWTVIFVPFWDDGAGFAATLGPSGKKQLAIMMPDDSKSTVMVSNVPDPYAMILAHELGHGLGIPGGDSHPTREGVLAGSHSPHGKEGILIDKTILSLINPTSSKAH